MQRTHPACIAMSDFDWLLFKVWLLSKYTWAVARVWDYGLASKPYDLMIEARLFQCVAYRQPGKGCFLAVVHWILSLKCKTRRNTTSALPSGHLHVHQGGQTLKSRLQILLNHSGSFMLLMPMLWELLTALFQPLQSPFYDIEWCCGVDLSLLMPVAPGVALFVLPNSGKWKIHFCSFRLRSTRFRHTPEALKLSTPKKIFAFPKLTWSSDPAKDEQVGFQWYAYAFISLHVHLLHQTGPQIDLMRIWFKWLLILSWSRLSWYMQIEMLVTEVQSLRGEVVSAEERETTLQAQYGFQLFMNLLCQK